MNTGLVYAGVTCHFETRRTQVAALDAFSLECPLGEITCLLGPNGAGKTTALAVAAGLLPSASGSVAFGGAAVTPTSPPSRMGYLPQQSGFPGVLSVMEVLDLGFSVRRTPTPARAEIVSLTGLGAVLDQEVGTLSSGWVRRLGLGVAIAPPSELLLLDEPFVGLDLDVLDPLLDHLRARAEKGTAVILSSHDFELVDQLDPRVAVLAEGKLQGVARAGVKGSRRLYRSMLAAEGLLGLAG